MKKRVFCLALALLEVLMLAFAAFAADTTVQTKAPSENMAGSVDQTYGQSSPLVVIAVAAAVAVIPTVIMFFIKKRNV